MNKLWLAVAVAAVITQVPSMTESFHFNQCVSAQPDQTTEGTASAPTAEAPRASTAPEDGEV